MGVLSWFRRLFNSSRVVDAPGEQEAKVTLAGGEVYVNPAVPASVRRNEGRIERLRRALDGLPESHPNYSLYMAELKRREALRNTGR